jgi:hypothetical protein
MGHFDIKKTEDMLAAHFFFGHGCNVMWSDMYHDALHATKLSLDLTLKVFICLFLFLVHLGRIFR